MWEVKHSQMLKQTPLKCQFSSTWLIFMCITYRHTHKSLRIESCDRATTNKQHEQNQEHLGYSQWHGILYICNGMEWAYRPKSHVICLDDQKYKWDLLDVNTSTMDLQWASALSDCLLQKQWVSNARALSFPFCQHLNHIKHPTI